MLLQAIGINQVLALVMSIAGYLADWVGLVLLADTDDKNQIAMSDRQRSAALFAIALGVLAWMRGTFTIQGDARSQALNNRAAAKACPAPPAPDLLRSLYTFVVNE
jgi:hypothetical protein